MAIDRTVKFTVRLNMLNPARVTINKEFCRVKKWIILLLLKQLKNERHFFQYLQMISKLNMTLIANDWGIQYSRKD